MSSEDQLKLFGEPMDERLEAKPPTQKVFDNGSDSTATPKA
jgi:hypothetical protein